MALQQSSAVAGFNGETGDSVATRSAGNAAEWARLAGTWTSTEFNTDWGLAALNAHYAYALGYTGAGIKVGVVDSGSDINHPELKGPNIHTNVVTGTYAADGRQYFSTSVGSFKKGAPYNVRGSYINGVNDPHGTHVTGTIAAARNGTGMHGVAFDSEVYTSNTNGTDESNYGPNTDYNYFLSAYGDLGASGARLINSSWGSPPPSENYTSLDGEIQAYASFRGKPSFLDAAADTARKYDLIQVWAAGNRRSANPALRGALPYFQPDVEKNWLSIGAYQRPGSGTADPNSVGIATNYTNLAGIAKYWTVFAPGTGITSTLPLQTPTAKDFPQAAPSALWKRSSWGPTSDPTYGTINGTSMAAPHATGALALVMQRYAYLGNEEARDILLTTATHRNVVQGTPDANTNAPNTLWGWGTINLQKAMDGPGQFLGAFRVSMVAGQADSWRNSIGEWALQQRKSEDAVEQAAWQQTLVNRGWDKAAPDRSASPLDQVRYETGIARAEAAAARIYRGSLVLDGAGSLTLAAGGSTYSGGTFLNGGTLELGATDAAGTGAIAFGAGAQTLRLNQAGTYANPISGFGLGDAIDLQSVSYAQAGPVVYDSSTGLLRLGQGAQATTLTMGPVLAGAHFSLAADIDGSTLLSLQQDQSPPPPPQPQPPGSQSGGTAASLVTTADPAAAGAAAEQAIQTLPAGIDAAAVERAVGIFLAGLTGGASINVSTFTPTPGATDIRIAGPTDGTQMLIAIDASGTPAGTPITLDNVGFVVVSGPASLVGGEGSQVLFGDDAAQSMVLGADDDTLHGGGGNDYVGSKGGNDLLFGDAGDDTVSGGIGADVLWGGTDQDLVYGNQDDDLIYGNQGMDTLYGGQGQDRAYGGQGDDRLFGNQGADMLCGNQGADLVYGNQGTDLIYGNQGTDTLYGGQGEDTLFGGQDADVIYGNLGADLIYGNKGPDLLYGGQGADVLYGGQGDDVLVGGLGDDVLVGGLGADRYVFGFDSGRDLILGFDQAAGDRLVLGDQAYTLGTAANGDAVLMLTGGGTVELAGIRTDQVGPALVAA